MTDLFSSVIAAHGGLDRWHTIRSSSAGGGPVSSIWYGLVTSGSGSQNIVVTGATFFAQAMAVYKVNGLGTNTPQSTGTGTSPAVINVHSGDFAFGVCGAQSSPTWSTSTETPANTHADTVQSPVDLGAADWTIISTTATFNAACGASTQSTVAANFR
jgi:hypothetical protein